MSNRLIICLDGTWNSSFSPVEREDKSTVLKPSNPLKLARAIRPVDPKSDTRQITYYDSGVGALGAYPGFSNKLLNFVDSKLGGAFGAGFEANIEQAVTFITHNHLEDTSLYIFGFSRGAAQARGLTQFISWLGGVPQKKDAYYIPIFFRYYLKHQGKTSPDKIKDSSAKETLARLQKVDVKFLGVWDTVMALGSRLKATDETSSVERSFHVKDTPPPCVLNARQALAIDEKRYDFRPEIWRDHAEHQTLEQRWFPGVHANVGGGYEKDGMANCALHWMVDEAKKHELCVDDEFLKKYKKYPQHKMGDTHTWLYKALEIRRWKLGLGARKLFKTPQTACLSIDRSAIVRLCSDYKKCKHMDGPYLSSELLNHAREFKDDEAAFFKKYGLEISTEYHFPHDHL